MLTLFIASLARDAPFDPDNRFEWAHLTVNMLGLQEAALITQEMIQNNGLQLILISLLVDVVTFT